MKKSWEDKVNELNQELFSIGGELGETMDKALDIYNEMKQDDKGDLEYNSQKKETKLILTTLLEAISDILNGRY